MHFILIHELVSLHHKGSWFSDFPFLCRREIKFKEEEKRKVSQRYACSNFKLYSFVYIHLLILTYKYHCLYELWFMSCMRDSLFVTGNDFMMLAFFFFNLITYVFEYFIWFLISLWLLCHKPFHTYSWFMENQAGKNIQLLWLFSLLFSVIPANQCHHQSLHKQNQELNQLMTLR